MQSLLRGFFWLLSKTIPIGTYFRIPVQVHLLLLVLAPLMAVPYFAVSRMQFPLPLALLFSLLFPVILFGSVLLHEFGHAWGTRLVGGTSDMILLTPIGGLHMGTGGMQSPRTELIVVALGPAVTLLLAALGHGLLAVLPVPGNPTLGGLYLLLTYFAHANSALLLFNLLLPIFPLDGSRLLRAGLSLRYNPERVTLRLTQVGMGIALFLLLVFFLSSQVRIQLPLVGFVDAWLLFIVILGLQACGLEQMRIRQDNVYEQSDTWGPRTVFYDSEAVAQAKARAREDLRSVFHLPQRSKVVKKSRPVPAIPRGPAKVVEVTPHRTVPALPQVPDPSWEATSDVAVLQRLMREAAEAENFELAARIKHRLEVLKSQSGAQSL